MGVYGGNQSSRGLLKGPGMPKSLRAPNARGILKGRRGSCRVGACEGGTRLIKRRGCVKGAGPLKGQKACPRG